MNLEVLVATMHQIDHSLLEKMNIQSDAIVGNQCNKNEIEEFSYNGHKIKYFSFNERGVGLNRNNILMRASADICLFADDDVVYDNGYREKVIKEFEKYPKADIIVFNIISTSKERHTYNVDQIKRIRFYNYMRYGTYRIAIRMNSIKSSNIYFSLLFGGGTKYSAGEDILFLTESLRKRLKIYASPIYIGTVSHDNSTWFKGYIDKFFKDKGILFYHVSKNWARLLCLQFVIRHRKMYKSEKNVIDSFKLMLQGIQEVK